MIAHPVKYFVVLIGVFGLVHLFVELLGQTTELPEWLTPRLAALWVTFLVAILWLLRSAAPDPAY